MGTRAEIAEESRVRIIETRRRRLPLGLTAAETTAIGWGAGLLGGVAMAVPLIVWDWVRSGHVALEFPMAATAWLFGLEHFSHTTYLVGPIVIGFALLCVYWVLSGLAFTGIADRVLRITTLGRSLLAGLAWSFVSFMLFWYMLLPIARDGAPFRATAAAPGSYVAPNWVWILAFVVFGIATGLFYSLLRRPTSSMGDERLLDPG